MADCQPLDLGCIGGNVVSAAADDAIEKLGDAILDGLSQMVTTLSTFWVSIPTANLTSANGAPSTVVSTTQDQLLPWTMAVAVFAVIFGGIRMIWEQRGAPLKDLLRSLITLVLVSGLGLGVISILVKAADVFSSAIISRATDGKGFASSMQTLVAINQGGTAVFILIILGLIGLLASLAQIVLMVVRSGMLVILAGVLPTTAAFTNTEMGRQWFQKAVGWTIAFILYKPAAAIVYAVAFRLMKADGTNTDKIVQPVTGFALMVVAIFALPALMRFVTPMVGAVASGSGAAAGAAVGALATGAVSLGRSGSGKGNATPAPPSTQKHSSNDGPKGTNATGAQGSTGQTSQGPSGPGGPSGGTGTKGASGTSGATTAAASTGAAKGATAASGPAGTAVIVSTQLAGQAAKAAEKTAQDSAGEGPSGSH